jgi:predicted kinase
MRKLLLVRGPQGSGKSTLLRELGLEPYTLSLDRVRETVAGPSMSPEGYLGINNELNNEALRLHKDLLEGRLSRGELVVVEQAIMMASDMDRYLAMAQTHRYAVALVDLSNMDLPTVQARNAQREERLRVPESAVAQTLLRLNHSRSSVHARPGLTVMESSDQLPAQMEAWLAHPVMDYTGRYTKVVHIGDLQGCLDVLVGPKGPLAQGLDPDTLYVFVGDLLDRGVQNGEVLRWFMDHALGKPNVILLYGNHEAHLDRWAKGLPSVSPEFTARTLPQLLEAGLTPADAGRIIATTMDLLAYAFHGHRVLVTHAGLPTVPERLERLSANQAIWGTGPWADPVDQRFDRMAPAGWVQVHGHRNHGGQAIQATPRSFNLEDGVEHGGALRTATLSAQGWTVNDYANPTFAPYREREVHADRRKLEPSWMNRPSSTQLPAELLALMRAHPDVREFVSASHPHIASLNFTRQVFYDQAWDEVVVKARGLFFNRETGEVVARAYDKFFNLDERPETRLDQVLAQSAFPITAYRKDNGFLGLIGYDRQNDALFFSSKSTPDSPFTAWLKDIYEGLTTPRQREQMRRYLRDMEACVAVEVIDPVRDPHLVDYPAPALTVLDVFHRSSDLERLPFSKLEAFATSMGLESKREEAVFRTPEALAGWHARVQHDLTYRKGGQDLEGFVLEDANANMVKIKLPHYSFWKTLRGAKDRLARLRVAMDENAARGRPGVNAQAIESVMTRYNHPQAEAFLRWTMAVPTAALREASILDLRRDFKASPAYSAAHEQVPWVPGYEREQAEPAPPKPAAPQVRASRRPSGP